MRSNQYWRQSNYLSLRKSVKEGNYFPGSSRDRSNYETINYIIPDLLIKRLLHPENRKRSFSRDYSSQRIQNGYPTTFLNDFTTIFQHITRSNEKAITRYFLSVTLRKFLKRCNNTPPRIFFSEFLLPWSILLRSLTTAIDSPKRDGKWIFSSSLVNLLIYKLWASHN